MTIVSETESLNEKREALKALLQKVDKKYKPSIFKHLLLNGYEQALYDYEIFDNYLDKPLCWSHYFTDSTNKRSGNHDNLATNLVGYKPNITSPPSMDTIIEAHLRHFVRSDKLYKNLAKYFRKEFLTEVLATNKALDGGSMKELREVVSPSLADELESRIVLDFAVQTKRQFKKGEDVMVFLNVKNIQKLTCKLFELDTLQYYVSNDRELDEMIDLDGLRPENTLEFRFGYPKQQQFVHKVVFEQLKAKDQGVFVAEFLGGAVSCRMIIRKGTLQLLPAEHQLGVACRIIDERKEVCYGDGTGVLVDGKFHQCDDKGQVVFPFNDVPVDNKRVLVVHKGFSCFTNLSLPKENYLLKAAVIFNEEGLVRDQINLLVVRNKLYLNSTPITLKKAGTCDCIIESKNFQEITNLREYKNQPIDDCSDLVLELPTLKLTSHIKVTIVMTFNDLRGKEVVLKHVEEITIDRNNNEDKFCSVHLKNVADKQTKQRSYYLELLGKNGEPVPHHRLQVEFLKSFGNYDFQDFIYTDKTGVANIGPIQDMKYITVECPKNLFKKRLFVLPSDYQDMDIPPLIELCVGEKLLLPALGRKLTKETFELVKVGPNPYNPSQQIVLADAFDSLKQELNSVVASSLTRGEYVFRYNLCPCTEIQVVVHEGERWGKDPYMLQKARSLTELRPESRYLSLNALKKTEQGLAVTFSSNNAASVRAHVLGYTFEPAQAALLRARLLATNPVFESRVTALHFVSGSLMAGRRLGDELAYVQRRKAAEALLGNTLDKPSLLLHREKVRETTEDAEVLRDGKGFDEDKRKEVVKLEGNVRRIQARAMDARDVLKNQCADLEEEDEDGLQRGMKLDDIQCMSESISSSASFFKSSKKKKGGIWGAITSVFGGEEQKFEGVHPYSRKTFGIRTERESKSFKIMNNMDFATQTGKLIPNLKPNDSGEIIIDPRDLQDCNIIQIVLVDSNATVVSNFQYQSSVVKKRELRVTNPMKSGVIWTENYQIFPTENKDGVQVFEKQNLSGAQSIVFDDLESLFNSLSVVANKKVDILALLKWNFIGSWDRLNLEEKFEKWESFGGTELSVFTYFRDRAFWDSYVKPLLLTKAAFSTEDTILLAISTGESRFVAALPQWASFGSLSPLTLLLMAIYDTTTARGCLEVAEGKSRQPDAADLKRLAESLLTQAQDAGSSAGPVLDDCKDPGAGADAAGRQE
jgi:hypothetical protein